MTAATPTRYSVAAVVRRDDGRFLAVRRPPDDEHLPAVWGLPAVTLKEGESQEDAVRRLGREKLTTELEPRLAIGTQAADRPGYRLVLTDFDAVLIGAEPDVRKSSSTSTRYTDQQWTNDLGLLRPAATMGSLCCQILLDRAGIPH